MDAPNQHSALTDPKEGETSVAYYEKGAIIGPAPKTGGSVAYQPSQMAYEFQQNQKERLAKLVAMTTNNAR